MKHVKHDLYIKQKKSSKIIELPDKNISMILKILGFLAIFAAVVFGVILFCLVTAILIMIAIRQMPSQGNSIFKIEKTHESNECQKQEFYKHIVSQNYFKDFYETPQFGIFKKIIDGTYQGLIPFSNPEIFTYLHEKNKTSTDLRQKLAQKVNNWFVQKDLSRYKWLQEKVCATNKMNGTTEFGHVAHVAQVNSKEKTIYYRIINNAVNNAININKLTSYYSRINNALNNNKSTTYYRIINSAVNNALNTNSNNNQNIPNKPDIDL